MSRFVIFLHSVCFHWVLYSSKLPLGHRLSPVSGLFFEILMDNFWQFRHIRQNQQLVLLWSLTPIYIFFWYFEISPSLWYWIFPAKKILRNKSCTMAMFIHVTSVENVSIFLLIVQKYQQRVARKSDMTKVANQVDKNTQQTWKHLFSYKKDWKNE